MPSSDKILEVLLQLGVVGQPDVQAATDLLRENATAAIAGGEATRDLGKKTGDAAQSVKLFTAHGEEFNRLIAELNRVTPGLGPALKAAFNPDNPGAAGLVSVIGQLVELLKQLPEAAHSAATDTAANPAAARDVALHPTESAAMSVEQPARQDVAEQVTPSNQHAAYDELVGRAQNYIADLNRPSESGGSNTAQAKVLADSIDALAKAAREHADRKMEAFIAQVNQMLKARQSANGI